MKYIDTSAFVKYYGKEDFKKGIEGVRSLFMRAAIGKEILVSSFFSLRGGTLSF